MTYDEKWSQYIDPEFRDELRTIFENKIQKYEEELQASADTISTSTHKNYATDTYFFVKNLLLFETPDNSKIKKYASLSAKHRLEVLRNPGEGARFRNTDPKTYVQATKMALVADDTAVIESLAEYGTDFPNDYSESSPKRIAWFNDMKSIAHLLAGTHGQARAHVERLLEEVQDVIDDIEFTEGNRNWWLYLGRGQVIEGCLDRLRKPPRR